MRKMLGDQVADRIASIIRTHPLRVAIDGIDAAGKTTFADNLVGPLAKLEKHVVRASLDGFHNPRIIRYRRGMDSPEGYFFDSFDYQALVSSLLEPLGPGGSLEYQTSIFDFRSDAIVPSPWFKAKSHSILIFDGVFLLRPELIGFWDFSVFLDVEIDEAVKRACQRDQGYIGSAEKVKERYRKRYVPGQLIYLETCQPKLSADMIIDNNDPANPRII